MATAFDTFNKLVQENVDTRWSKGTSRTFLENDTSTFIAANVNGDRVQQPQKGGTRDREDANTEVEYGKVRKKVNRIQYTDDSTYSRQQ